ncbi:MAG: LamB/YcsF family protein, partial [Pseudomonadota bacterium]
DLAREVVAAAARVLPEAAMVGLPGSKIMEAAEGAGLKFVAEGFADRAYTAAGQLVSRSKPGAVIEDEAARIAQALALAAGGPMTAITGEEISLKVQIICIHSDSPSALDSAKAIRTTLEQEGFTIGVPAS